jgi:hypothetical protein
VLIAGVARGACAFALLLADTSGSGRKHQVLSYFDRL